MTLTNATVDVYKNGVKLGAGTASSNNASIASYTATNSRVTGAQRNVQVTVTQAGNSVGRTWNARVLTDGGTSLTLREVCPYL